MHFSFESSTFSNLERCPHSYIQLAYKILFNSQSITTIILIGFNLFMSDLKSKSMSRTVGKLPTKMFGARAGCGFVWAACMFGARFEDCAGVPYEAVDSMCGPYTSVPRSLHACFCARSLVVCAQVRAPCMSLWACRSVHFMRLLVGTHGIASFEHGCRCMYRRSFHALDCRCDCGRDGHTSALLCRCLGVFILSMD